MQQSQKANKVIQLAGGYSLSEGRVEIKANGLWNTICDFNFSIESANAICNHFGYPGAVEAFPYAYFGKGKGPIRMMANNCIKSGKFTSGSCPTTPEVDKNCTHANDVGVICFRKY